MCYTDKEIRAQRHGVPSLWEGQSLLGPKLGFPGPWAQGPFLTPHTKRLPTLQTLCWGWDWVAGENSHITGSQSREWKGHQTGVSSGVWGSKLGSGDIQPCVRGKEGREVWGWGSWHLGIDSLRNSQWKVTQGPAQWHDRLDTGDKEI